MPYEMSQTVKSILTLMNNVEELITLSNDRKSAKEVMQAVEGFAQTKNFPIPESKIKNFYKVLLDSRTNTLSGIIHEISSSIIETDKKRAIAR
jgi:hypothetical protein